MKLYNQLHEVQCLFVFKHLRLLQDLTAEEHEPVRLSNDARNRSLYVGNEPIFQPFLLLDDDLSTSTASLSVCDRTHAAHSADTYQDYLDEVNPSSYEMVVPIWQP